MTLIPGSLSEKIVKQIINESAMDTNASLILTMCFFQIVLLILQYRILKSDNRAEIENKYSLFAVIS